MDANNINEMREALAGLIDGICFHCDLSEDCKGAPCEKMQKAKAALAKPPRACDLMTEEELSRVVSRNIVASVSSRPELNEEWIKSLVGAAVIAAIKCAYDTQLKSSKESNNDD